SPDSGTCGPDWADDTFDRHFTVQTRTTGITVIEQFKRGTFVTRGGFSPGACEIDSKHGSTVNPGVTGEMHGYFIITNVSAQTSTSPFCDATLMTNENCTTTKFIDTHFEPCYHVTCEVTTFFDHYSSGDQKLIYHEWKNASDDRGGNHGDIANS